MKKLILFLIVGLLFSTYSLSASTWRVNNNNSIDADFTNLQDAHDAAQDGDTIMLEGSPTPYGGATLRKRLVLIGPGYFLAENPNTPIDFTAIVERNIIFGTDSEDANTGAARSQIMGVITDNIYIQVNDVIISKCLIQGEIGLNSGSNVVLGVIIQQNYITDPFNINNDRKNVIQDITIKNNIFTKRFIGIPKGSSGAILNNLFLGEQVKLEDFIGEMRSNIVFSTSNTDITISIVEDGQMSHNVGANGQFGTNNNSISATPSTLFLGATDNSTDGQWQLKPNSPASNNGHDGADRGPFGGTLPYSLSGQGSIPVLTFLQVQPSAIQNQKLSIKLKAISGN